MSEQLSKPGSQDAKLKAFLVCHPTNGKFSVIYSKDPKVDSNLSLKTAQPVEGKVDSTVRILNQEKKHRGSCDPSMSGGLGHWKITDQGTEYICDMGDCKRSFSSLVYLRSHQTVHYSKELKCSYPECGRKFTWAHHLQYHLKTHKGEKPYKCEVASCCKSFCTRQQMSVHMRTHTGTKPFTCEICKKDFTTLQNKDNHARTHTGVKPYVCDFAGCTKKFAESSSLKKHVVVHTGEKPYKCVHCQKCFTQSSSLRVHISRYHTENAVPSKSIANIQLQVQQQRLQAQQAAATVTKVEDKESEISELVETNMEPKHSGNTSSSLVYPGPSSSVASNSVIRILVPSQSSDIVVEHIEQNFQSEPDQKNVVYDKQIKEHYHDSELSSSIHKEETVGYHSGEAVGYQSAQAENCEMTSYNDEQQPSFQDKRNSFHVEKARNSGYQEVVNHSQGDQYATDRSPSVHDSDYPMFAVMPEESIIEHGTGHD